MNKIIVYSREKNKFIAVNIKTAMNLINFCVDCYDTTDVHTVKTDRGTIKLCQFCLNRYYTWCNHCNRYFNYSKIINLGNMNYCRDCAEKLFPHYNCSSCGEVLYEERDYYLISPSGNIYCYTCAERGSYRYTNQFIEPLNSSISKAYYGIEIELYCGLRRELSKYIIDNYPEIVLRTVRDGSLENDIGFEINLQPLPFQFFYSERFNDFIESLLEYGSYTDDSCGLHIHIDRRCITKLTIYKFYLFLVANEEFATKISGRWDFHYCDISSSELLKNRKRLLNKPYTFPEKYSVINTLHEETYELRLFVGSVRREKILAYLEFFESMRMYLSTVALNDATNLEKYKNFIDKNKKSYSYLYDFLREV